MSNKKSFVALRHKFIPGPRVLSKAVWEKHLKKHPEGSVLKLIGEAATESEALELCKVEPVKKEKPETVEDVKAKAS